MYKGMTVVAAREFDPAGAWQTINDEGITVSLLVPAMLLAMLPVFDADQHDISELRFVLSGAAPVPVTLIEQYAQLGVEIHQAYGLTEAGGLTNVISADQAITRAGSTGTALFHTSVRVVRDDGTDVDPDEPGEVIISSPHTMIEYWNRPEATAETIRDGWLHTGDVGVVDAEGFLSIRDRTKDMIISGGENIYPAEVENVILSHPSVHEVAVIGQPSERWGESPFAVVVRSDDSLSGRDVIDWCDGKIARFKIPVDAAFIDELPRNPSGKILKRLLREQFPGPVE